MNNLFSFCEIQNISLRLYFAGSLKELLAFFLIDLGGIHLKKKILNRINFMYLNHKRVNPI